MIKYKPFHFETFKKIWHTDVSQEDAEEICSLITNNPLLHETLLLQGSALAILNIETMHYSCILGNPEKVAGFEIENYLEQGVKFFLSQIPLADYSALEKMLAMMNNYYLHLSNEQAHNFKAIFDFKVRRSDNTLSRICQENLCLKRGKNGSILLLFALVSDVTNLKKDGKQHFYLTNGEEQLLYMVDNEYDEMQPIEPLSKRELEIAKLMGQNLTSEQIGDKLCISPNTVNTHRRKILRKVGMSDTLELINFLRVFRLI
jgi:DNA-binding CsgD family transcriptional regulator